MKKLLLLHVLLWLFISISAQQSKLAADKLSPALRRDSVTLPAYAEQTFWLVTTQTDSVKKWLTANALPVSVIAEYPSARLLVIKTRRGVIDSLLLPSSLVRFIDIPRKAKEEQAIHNQDFSVNSISKMHHDYSAINGNGLVVSVKENRPDTADIDFKGRMLITPLMATELSTHATEMSTAIAGGGNSFYTGKGIAWAATLTSSSFASILPDGDAAYNQYNISVQNHSYGTTVENYYGADAVAYDAGATSIPSLLHVFSAGNSGYIKPTSGIYAGIDSTANLTGSFKMAKNILTVGAVDSFNVVAPLSSKGPAYDGRIKPELVAFGQDGSSGAAAIVSGIALTLQHAYKNTHSNQLPPVALVKAILINSAEDIGTPGPDFQSGYGTVNAYKAMQTIQQQHYYSGSVNTGQQQSFPLSVPAGIRKLKITLCWMDLPAAPNAAKALVNDLDLALVNTQTNQTWQPWVLSTYPHRDSLMLAATRKRDSLNTVEQITLDNPAAGNYNILVQVYSLQNGAQSFSIALQTDTADLFSWYYPTSTDYLLAGKQNTLRWSNTFTTNSGILYYSIDKGNSWQSIGQTDLTKGFTTWQAPDTLATAIFRMSIDGKNYLSDTSIISMPTSLHIGFNCGDSVLLYWNKIPSASYYSIYQLGNNYLEPFITTQDTSLMLHTNINKSLYYTVTPVADRQGIKAYTVNYTTQGAGCYINNLLAVSNDDHTASLTLTLGTLYNIAGIVLEKFNGSNFEPLHNFAAGNDLIYSFTDKALHKGGNIYRAHVTLVNGNVAYSSQQIVYNFDNTGYLVFPNPLTGNTLLQIRSNDLQPKTIVLYNELGQCVKQQSMNNATTQLSLAGLPKGIYWLVIVKDGKVEFKTVVVNQR
ncbi:MAG: S8 family peptidase [Chitinophagaceae bacterium]